MSQIRWDELSEARQLARLGKSLSRAAQTRLQWMLFYLFNGRNVARTCRHFGISRQTFYRWRRRFDRHDLTTLEGRSHRPRNTRQPTWTTATAERVLALRKQYPCWGKDKLVVLLAREKLYRSTAAASSPPNSSWPVSKNSSRCLCFHPSRRNSTPMSSAPIARITKSSTRCTPTPISPCGSITSCVTGNTPTTACALTSR